MILPCGRGRRRADRGVTIPWRFRMSPIVEAAGHAISGRSLASFAKIFFGPKRGNFLRIAMIDETSSSGVACGQRSGARENSSYQSSAPLSRRRFQT